MSESWKQEFVTYLEESTSATPLVSQALAGCPRSRAFRDLGFHSPVNLGILFDGRTESLRFFHHKQPV